MKKTVLKFGLLSGAVAALLMVATMPFIYKIGFDWGMYVGYTNIVLSFLLVFFGIRSYRENVGRGSISFGKAFGIGILITLISTICYVITWEILYYTLLPDFVEKWSSFVIEQLRASGASQTVIDAKLQEMKTLKAMMDNPLINAALVFLEPLPVGLLVTLISAAILRKRKKDSNAGLPVAAVAD